MLGAPHEQPIFTPVFEKNVICSGANRAPAAFQLRFCSLEVLSFLDFFIGSQNIRVPQSQTFGQTYFFVFQLRFSWQKQGAHPLR